MWHRFYYSFPLASFSLPYYHPIATMPHIVTPPVVPLGAVLSSSPVLLPITLHRLSIHPLSLCWPPGLIVVPPAIHPTNSG